MVGFSCARRAFPKTVASAPRPLFTRRIFRAMRLCPNASPHPLIRCRARCKSRRGHCAEALICRLDFWGFRALFRAPKTSLSRFALHPDSEDSGLTPIFVWSLLWI